MNEILYRRHCDGQVDRSKTVCRNVRPSSIAPDDIDVGRFGKGESELGDLCRPWFWERDIDFSMIIQTLFDLTQLKFFNEKPQEG